jgi:hypothetical protein
MFNYQNKKRSAVRKSTPLGETILDLKQLFNETAAQSFGASKPVFDSMRDDALKTLKGAEHAMIFDPALSVNMTRLAVVQALDREREIKTTAQNDNKIREIFDSFAEKAIVKGIDALQYGIDIYTENREALYGTLCARTSAKTGNKTPNTGRLNVN